MSKTWGCFLVAQDMVLSYHAKFQLINFFWVKAISTGLLGDEFADGQKPSSREISEVSCNASMDIDDAITNMHCETGSELNLLKFWSCSQIKRVLPKLSKLAIRVFSNLA